MQNVSFPFAFKTQTIRFAPHPFSILLFFSFFLFILFTIFPLPFGRSLLFYFTSTKYLLHLQIQAQARLRMHEMKKKRIAHCVHSSRWKGMSETIGGYTLAIRTARFGVAHWRYIRATEWRQNVLIVMGSNGHVEFRWNKKKGSTCAR